MSWLDLSALLDRHPVNFILLTTTGKFYSLTQQLVGRGCGEIELLFQILPKEGRKASYHRDLHACGQDDAREHWIGEQVLGDFWDHWREKEKGRLFHKGAPSLNFLCALKIIDLGMRGLYMFKGICMRRHIEALFEHSVFWCEERI